MKFELWSAQHWDNSVEVLKDYPQIEQNFKVELDSKVDYTAYIIIDSLEDLIKFTEIIECSIVFDVGRIMIYDGYLE